MPAPAIEIPAFLRTPNDQLADAIETQRSNVRPIRAEAEPEKPAKSEKPKGKKRPPTKSEMFVADLKSAKDQTGSRIQALQARRAAKEEETAEAIRQLEASRDGELATIDAELTEENVILASQNGGIEAAAAAVTSNREAAE